MNRREKWNAWSVQREGKNGTKIRKQSTDGTHKNT